MHDQETEIKLRVADPRAIKRKLASLGFVPAEPRHFERNLLFDFPDLRLRHARSVLRLRFERARNLVTFKGAPLDSPGYKVRREIETEVKDGRRLKEAFEALGLREVFRYEKYRTAYAARRRRKSSASGHAGQSGQVVYDETPIGNFIELEGPKRWIDALAHQFGYGRNDYVTASYVALYLAKCAEDKVKPGNMVFRQRK
jgi:adenylate cyclase class 2